jgi:glutathione S-transferase
MITLYDYELSGNCYKIRLLLSILSVSYKTHVVEFYPAAEHKQDWFLQINPLGSLPVLADDDFVLTDSAAILVYLASEYDKTQRWYPRQNHRQLASIAQWLAFAEALTGSASAARLAEGFFYDIDLESAQQRAHQLLRILDEHLWFAEHNQQRWIVPGEHPTIADIACFPYIMLSEEGGISRQDYPAIRRWCDNVKRIPGFIVMPGLFPAGPAPEVAATT